jgi:Domain of unknown function (DUF6468)
MAHIPDRGAAMDTGLPVSLIVEGTLTLLLAATLASCALLERRLRGLRTDHHKLVQTVISLNSAIADAQASFAALRDAAHEADDRLGVKVGMARKLVQELSLLASTGERIAARMEAVHDDRVLGNPPQRRVAG